MNEPIIYNKLKNNFSQISNFALLDTRLSSKAYKLYAYICYRIGLSENWQFSKNEILKHFSEGESAMRSAFNELIKAGFLERKRVRNSKGIFKRTDYIIYAEPVNTDSNPQVENPLVDNPLVAKPRVENQPHNNKERNNKDSNNKNFSLSEMQTFWQGLKEREKYNFEIDVKKFYEWCCDEEKLKGSWKNIMKIWAKKSENQIKKSTVKISLTVQNKNEERKNKIESDIKFLKGNTWIKDWKERMEVLKNELKQLT